MLRLWTAAPTRGGFQALVRPVESEHWLGFTEPAALLAFLLRPEAVSREEP